jgi:translation initiation factor IF-3
VERVLDKSKKIGATKDRFRMNSRIRAREVRLIADDGDQVGIVSTREALNIAEERNLDLVEVAPNANPPVCRLMDYGKFRYEQSKKEREARKHQKQTELKELRLKPKTDTHDLEVKANQARRFLLAGDKVKFTVRFRGREMAHTNIGREILDFLLENLRDVGVVEQKPMLEGRAISVVLAPNSTKTSSKSSKKPRKPQDDTAGQSEPTHQPDQTDQAGHQAETPPSPPPTPAAEESIPSDDHVGNNADVVKDNIDHGDNVD